MTTTTIVPERAPEIRPARNRTGVTLSKYLIVKDGGAGPDTVALTAADTDVALGVLREDIVDGANGDMAVEGAVRVIAGGAISAGARVGCGANGKANAAVSTKSVIGVAKDAAVNDGDIIIVELAPAGTVW